MADHSRSLESVTATSAAAPSERTASSSGAPPRPITTRRRRSATDDPTNLDAMIMEQYHELEGAREAEGGLVHLPLRGRESVLRERELHGALEEERDEDANATFARWSRSRHENNDGGGGDEQGRKRVLQEFSGEGTHFIDAYVGSPAQKRVLAVSSGADFTAFPCEGCSRCGPVVSEYRQSDSASFVSMPCGRCVGGQRDDVCDAEREGCVARGYNLVDKSAWTAYEARDYVYVGGAEAELLNMNLPNLSDPTGTDVPSLHGFPLVFACQTEATGWYASQVQDGVIGFSTARTSFVNQMVFQDRLTYPRFCMCFEQKLLMGDDYRSAGLVTLGGYNPHILDAPLAYVQNVEKAEGARYKVRVRNVYLRQGGGQSITPDRDGQAVVRLKLDEDKFNEKNGGTIVDSGVPLLIFDESLQQSFLEEWEKMVGKEFTFGKMLMTESDVMALPTLILQIQSHDGVDKSFNPRTVPNMAGDRDPQNPFDALLAIPATHYMEYNPSTGTYRARINLFSKIGSFIGINAMQGHAFFFDLAKDRIGFAESYNCMPKMSPAGLVDDDMFELPSVQIATNTGRDSGGKSGNGPLDGGMPGAPSAPGAGPNSQNPDGDAVGIRPDYVGTCVTATCISFVTLGYCIVVIALAVAYKKYKPRDRSKQFDREINDGDDFVDDETEVLNPAFEQHVRSTGGASVRGSAVMV